LTEVRPTGPRPRIEGLSDLIFGLALSIGAIQLIGSAPGTQTALLTSVGAFGFSFLILISIWNRYTAIASTVPVESTAMVRLNMLLLFLVALEPYLFNLLMANEGSPAYALGQDVSALYALDIGGMNLVLAYFTHILSNEEKSLVPREAIGRFKSARNALLVVSLVFIVSALPFFWTVSFQGTQLRFLLWIVSIPAISLSRRLSGERRGDPAKPAPSPQADPDEATL
jgi:uncharacterized membrane protein